MALFFAGAYLINHVEGVDEVSVISVFKNEINDVNHVKYSIDGTYFAKNDGDDTIYKVTNYYVDSLITDREQFLKTNEE